MLQPSVEECSKCVDIVRAVSGARAVSVLKVLTQEHAQPCQARPAGLLLTTHKCIENLQLFD